MTAPADAGLEARIAGLRDLPIEELRCQWQLLHGVAPPPRLSRDLLSRGIAYRLQEQAYGGLSAALKRRLRSLSKMRESGTRPNTMPRPGARLIREWHGRTHTVILGFVIPHARAYVRGVTK